MPSPYRHSPRLRTTAATPTAPSTVEVNGVLIPVESWTMSPLGFYRDSGPVEVSLTFYAEFATEPEPETPEQLAERVKAEQEAARTEAADHWQAVRREHLDLIPVLNLHRPVWGYGPILCDHCEQSDGMEGTDHVPWPCATYTALTSVAAPMSTVWEPQGAGVDEDGHPLVKAEGFTMRRDVYEALHRVDPAAPCTVNVTVQGPVASEQHFAEAIRRAIRRQPPEPFAAFKR